MPQAPRVPEAEWSAHKALITDLWINQNKTLDEVMQHMAAIGFCPSRPQWIRKINVNWKLRKNSTKEEWQHASSLLSKRKGSGKESDLLMNGRVVPSKKRMKELKRYSTSQTTQISQDSDRFHAVVISTPPPSGLREVSHENLPSLDSARSCSPTSQVSDLPTCRSPDAPLQQHVLKASPNEPCILNYNDMLEGPCFSEAASRTIEKVHEMFPVFEAHRKKEQSQQPVWIQIFQALLLISTNNLWHDVGTSFDCLDYFLNLVLIKGILEDLKTLLIATKKTNGNLATHLLFSALKVDSAESLVLMRFLLRHGVCPNSTHPKRSFGAWRWTALHDAVYWNSQGSVKLLIESGANPHPSLDTPLLRLSLRIIRPERLHDWTIMKLPKGAGAYNTLEDYDHCYHFPPLFQAIRNGSLCCAQTLLDTGLNPNYFRPLLLTALHCAIDMNEVGIVHILIKAGALPNIRLGEQLSALSPNISFDYHKAKTVLTPIQSAVRSNRLTIVEYLLHSGAILDRVRVVQRYRVDGVLYTESAESCLQISASTGNYDMMCLLLTSNADPNSRHENTPTALQTVCGSASMSPLERYHASSLLLRHRADVNASPMPRGGRTALQAAVEVNDYRLANLLLSEGANPNTPATEGGITVMEAAIKCGSEDLKRLLINKGNHEAVLDADNNYINQKRYLELAASAGNATLLRSICIPGNCPNSSLSDEDVEWAVKAAIVGGSLSFVQELMNIYHQVDKLSVLCETICQGKDEILDWILDHLPPHILNLSSWGQPSPLWIALHQRSCDVVRRLLVAGADPNQTSYHLCRPKMSDTSGCPVGRQMKLELPIRQAVSPGHGHWEEDKEMVELLVSHGAQIDCSVKGENNLLLLALQEEKYEIADFLLRKGANPDVTDQTNKSALTYALGATNYSLVKSFIEHGANVTESTLRGSPIQALITCGGYGGPNAIQDLARTCQLLLDAGADVNTEPNRLFPMTALQTAIDCERQELVEILLERGANIHAPAFGDGGKTALQAAASTGNFKLVKRLVGMGAYINAPPAKDGGATALQYAAISGHVKMAIYLLGHGASINATGPSTEGVTVMQGAAENGRLDMIQFLLENDQDPDMVEERCRNSAGIAEDQGFTQIAEFLTEYKRP